MLIELNHVTKTYGKVIALEDLSVTLPVGATGLLGPNGAGKTTMIRTLLGLIRIDSGEGRVLGRDIRRDRLAIRQVVGLVPENECLFPGLIGVEFVAYAGELVGMQSRDALRRAHEVLDYVELGEARYRRVESYSSGMKQRLKIAAALVHDPQLLILDEPTNGMDPASRDDVLELTHDLAHNKGMSLLFSSHLLPDVEAVCDHVMVLGHGRLLACDRIDVLKERHELEFELRVKGDQGCFARELATRGIRAEQRVDHLLVSLPAAATGQIVWQTALETGEQIRSLRPRRSTLEEVFLKALAKKN
jgi:ABC-2 type transport system ATP-binding protein